MIQITYYRNTHTLTARGHARSAEKGHDLVCAAVSALVLTLAFNVASLVTQGNAGEQVLHVREGDAQIGCKSTGRMEAVVTLMFDTVCAGFALLQTLYPENIQYRIKA